MLTSASAEIIAYLGEHGLLCVECATRTVEEAYPADREEGLFELEKARYGLPNGTGLSPLIRYVVETEWAQEHIASCEGCGVIVWQDDHDDDKEDWRG